MVNRHFILFALAFAAALSGFAKTFDVDISTGRPAASNEAYYHGETIEFRAVRGRSVVTNVEYSCVYYQTNGMGDVWWKTDGLTFHPTNDVGAASYRFFMEGRDDLGRDWHANGLLRLLPSPGFTPNEITMPVATLDFSGIEVLNAPWPEEIEAVARGVASNEIAIASVARQVASNELAIASVARGVASNELEIASVARGVASKLDAEEYTPTRVIPVGLYRLESVDDDPSAVDADNLVFEGVGTYVRPRSKFEISEDSVGFIIKAVLAPARNFSYGNLSTDEYADSTGVPIRFAIGDIISIQDSLGFPDYMCMASNVVQELPPVQMTLGQSISNVVTKAYVEDLGISADFSTNNTELVDTIKDTAPAPGDYSTVSNKAMTALQSFTETDPTVSSWAKAATKPSYSWNEIGSKPSFATVATSGSYNDLSNKPTIPTVPTNVSAFNNDAGYLTGYTETDPTVKSWAKAATKPTYTASEVGAATTEDVYRLITGTNVVLVITNYNSAVHAPSMKLQHLDPDTNEYVTYWDETRRHGLTLTNAMDYADAAAAAEVTRADEAYAPRAWSRTTSGLGADAPDGVTWISTPETVIAGGYEYEKVITTAGAVWVLTSNGLSTGATTNSYFRVAASDGTELFSIEKTDSYLVGVNADDITKSGNTVTIPVNVVAPSHPYIRATTNLVNAVWTKEDENGFTCPFASVSWSGSSGAYVATVTCSQPQAFFYFEFMQQGTAKIKNSAKTEMTGGIIFNGTTYMPTVNGNKLEFIAQ